MDDSKRRLRIRYKILETEGTVFAGHGKILQDYNCNRTREDSRQKDVQILDNVFAQECLRSHNHFRTEHGCKPLHLSVEVSRFSQQWAEHISREDHLYHSHHPRYGENLFVNYISNQRSLPEIKGSNVVESWYSEYKFYPFNEHVTKETIQKAGHFIQVVWCNSRELGIGRAVSKSNRVYVVANYYPAGNILKKCVANVPEKIHKIYGNHHHYYANRLLTRATQYYNS